MVVDVIRLSIIIVGLILGYGAGRYLWSSRRLAVAPFPIIAAVATLGLISARLFAAANLESTWQDVFFPLIVSLGAGFSITAARPPLLSPWWQIWRN